MKCHILFALILLVSVTYALPQPTGYVNDFANILPERAYYEQGLRLYEENTTIEVAVVTLDSVPEGYTLFDYGVELFQQWGIGKKGEDNGILILMVKNGTIGNRLRIELGWGIQGYITGAEAGAILDDALPYYNQGDYQTALDVILGGLSDQLVNYVPGQPVKDRTFDIATGVILANFPFFFFLILIIISVVMSNRCPYCRGKITCEGEYCTCLKCKKKFKRNKRYAPIIVGGFGGGGGGGFGGFGGGGSGGGGAGR